MRADGYTNGHYEADILYSQIAEVPKVILSGSHIPQFLAGTTATPCFNEMLLFEARRRFVIAVSAPSRTLTNKFLALTFKTQRADRFI
jgi:hypothetical protein